MPLKFYNKIKRKKMNKKQKIEILLFDINIYIYILFDFSLLEIVFHTFITFLNLHSKSIPFII